MLRQARRNPDDAQNTYQRVVQVRRYLYELFGAVAMGHPPPDRGIAALGSDEAEALARAELVSGDGGVAWTWAHDNELARPLRPIVHAAVTLLTGCPLQRVKRCDGCPWLFIDESKTAAAVGAAWRTAELTRRCAATSPAASQRADDEGSLGLAG